MERPPLSQNQYQVVVEDFDPEELDKDQFCLYQRATSGAIAGLVEHISVYPFDTLKTNQQTGHGEAIRSGRKSLIRFWLTSPAWRGVSILGPGVTVAHGAQFPTIEYTTEWLEKRQVNFLNPSLIGGVVGALPHDLIMNPCNVVKQRMQICTSSYRTPLHCATHLYRTQGIRPFYQSFPTQYLISGFFLGSYYYLYNDMLRNLFNRKVSPIEMSEKAQSILPIVSFAFRSVIATVIACTLTQPLDNIVTRINTGYEGKEITKCVQTCKIAKSNLKSSTLNAALRSSLPLNCPKPGQTGQAIREISVNSSKPPKVSIGYTYGICSQLYQEKSFMKGYQMRLCMAVPANFLTWGTYEILKVFWGRYN